MPRSKSPAPVILSPEPSPSVSQETLEQTPPRLHAFLYGANLVPAVWGLLEERGYSAEEHARGWALLQAASWLKGGVGAPLNGKVRGAVTALDTWDEGGFRLVTASLKHRHPDQAAFVLDGIGPSVGPEAVMGVKTLLDRLDELESGEGRPQSARKADQAALSTLAARGIDKAERDRLRALVDVAQGEVHVDVEAVRAREKSRDEALRAARAFYEEWSEVARVVLKRRDHLIRLGLAKRRSSKKAPPPVPAPVTPSPAAPAP